MNLKIITKKKKKDTNEELLEEERVRERIKLKATIITILNCFKVSTKSVTK